MTETTQTATPTAATRTWSPFQTAIFDEIAAGGSTNVVVLARAGSGKTTTIVEAMKYAPRGAKVLFCAFNKKIQQELASRIPAGVDARTLHSLGLAACKRQWPRIQIEPSAEMPFVFDAVESAHYRARREIGFVPDLRSDPYAKADVAAVKKLVSLAKNTLAATKDEVEVLAADYDVCTGYLSSEGVAEAVVEVLDATRTPGRAMSFDDMIWLPIVHNLPLPQYDIVFVDETQDLNAAQIALIQRANRGRIVAVGDDRQAIYGFRGASTNAIPDLVKGIAAKTLPLSISYRCAQEIVRLAKSLVPDIEPAPTAPVGRVWNTNLTELLSSATPGDFVLSRTNAGAVTTCLALLRKGVPATVVGRDIGASLAKLVEQATTKGRVRDLDGLCRWVDEWLTKTITQARKRAERLHRSPDATIQSAEDRAEVLREIASTCMTLTDLQTKLGSLFSDDENFARVTCSTVHKAKGLEANRAWVLTDTWKFSGPEENNLRYVAYTRAKQELALVVTKDKEVE